MGLILTKSESKVYERENFIEYNYLMSSKTGWLVLAALLFVGVIKTVADWKQWRYEETAKFGQGWGDRRAESMALDGLYQNTLAGVRIKYPAVWTATNAPQFATHPEGVRLADKVAMGSREQVAEIKPYVTILVERGTLSLSDWADREVARIQKEGYSLRQERDYINTDKVNLVVLTWEEGEGGQKGIRRRAAALKENVFVIIESDLPAADENKYSRTIEEMWRSLVLL